MSGPISRLRKGPKISNQFKNELVKRITLQQFNWVPLTKRYAKRKKRDGKDQRILIRDKKYIKGIRVRHPSKLAWVVDLPAKIHPGTVSKNSKGISYRLLGMVHEYGSRKRNIPARPHWRPVTRDFMAKGPDIVEGMSKRLHTVVSERMDKILSGLS